MRSAKAAKAETTKGAAELEQRLRLFASQTKP